MPVYGGMRLVDLDEDGALDLVMANAEQFAVYLFEDMQHGWSRKVVGGKTGDPNALPPLVRRSPEGGTTDNGFWVPRARSGGRTRIRRSSRTWLIAPVVQRPPQGSPGKVGRRRGGDRSGFAPGSSSSWPRASWCSIAFDWSADGRLWVVEMGGYPLGVDGKESPAAGVMS
ncbi:MAG: hypothetical protein U0794_05895 [Isosphaeraceae bacterium]